MNKLLLLALAGTILLGSAVFLVAQQKTVKDAPITESVMKQWKMFKATYNKKFSDPDTEAYRMEIFADNLQTIADDQTGTLGITQFADISQAEFAETYLTLEVNEQAPKKVTCQSDISLE